MESNKTPEQKKQMIIPAYMQTISAYFKAKGDQLQQFHAKVCAYEKALRELGMSRKQITRLRF